MSDINKPVISFKTKLFLLVLFAFGGLMCIILWGIQTQADRLANEEIDASLTKSRQIVFRRLESRYVSIQETAANLARDGRIRPAVYASETSTLMDMSGELAKSLPFDILIFVNQAGDIISRSDDVEAVGYSVARSPLFSAALAGSANQGIMSSQGKLLQVVALPVFDNAARDIVRGAVALAYRIDQELVDEIHALTGADLLFYSFPLNEEGKENAPVPFISTVENEGVHALMQEPSRWGRVLRKELNEEQLDLHGEVFQGAYMPLEGSSGEVLGFALALRSRSEIIRPFREIEKRALLAGLGCMLGASLLAFLIARRMTQPLLELVSVTGKIEQGEYPESKVMTRRDEMGVLYNAVFRMGQKLKEKEELESYLAKMNDEAAAFATDEVNSQDPTRVDFTRTLAETVPHDVANLTTTSDEFLNDDQVAILRSGSRLGDRFTIRNVLGAGAMGVVYLADDKVLDEAVAIKMINTDKISLATIELLKKETRLSRRISHPNVLRNHDFGMFDKHYFISMELVLGQTLDRLIQRRGALEERMGLILARQMCSAVVAAHQEGIVHRDLKPQNMMITRRGVLKVMDFGIAFAEGEEGAGKGFAGTPAFMAPEQFAGVGIDHRCDIYALGVILFFLFTGKYPFAGKNQQGIMAAHVEGLVPDPRSLNPNLPNALAEIIIKAMQKSKAARYQTASEMLVALGRL